MPMKIAKKYHAFWAKPSGGGIKATTMAATTGAKVLNRVLIEMTDGNPKSA